MLGAEASEASPSSLTSFPFQPCPVSDNCSKRTAHNPPRRPLMAPPQMRGERYQLKSVAKKRDWNEINNESRLVLSLYVPGQTETPNPDQWICVERQTVDRRERPNTKDPRDAADAGGSKEITKIRYQSSHNPSISVPSHNMPSLQGPR